MENKNSHENLNLFNHEICILYGSQTNTAKLASEELERELWKYDYKTLLQSLDSYDITNLPDENFIIFIVSTTGYGEPPANMKNFWKFILQKDLSEDSLENVNYTIFGLGDSSYEKFNIVAKMLNTRLKQLSANLFHPVALGDDQHDFGYEGEFDPWCKSVIETLNYEIFQEKKLVNENPPFTPKYKTKIIKNEKSSELNNEKFCNLNKLNTLDKMQLGKIYKMDKLTTDDSLKQVIHLQINSYNEEEIKYNPGDIALIYPRNSFESIKELMSLYNIEDDDLISIEINSEYAYYNSNQYIEKINCKEFFESWLNINGIPNRRFCGIAADFTDEEIHKEKLLLFSSKTTEGKDEFYRYCGKEKRTYIELLKDFKSVKIPLNILIELVGRMPPREFSIASSSKVTKSSVNFICLFLY